MVGGKRKQPEWFVENAEELKPLIEKKNEAHERLIATNSAEAKREFRQRQRLVQRAVDRAWEDWIRRVAKEGEAAIGREDGRVYGSCSRSMLDADQPDQMQSGRRMVS